MNSPWSPVLSSFKKYYLSLVVLGRHCCMRASSGCGRRGFSLVVMRALLTVVASLAVSAQALGLIGCSSCSIWAQQLLLMGLAALWHVEFSQ